MPDNKPLSQAQALDVAKKRFTIKRNAYNYNEIHEDGNDTGQGSYFREYALNYRRQMVVMYAMKLMAIADQAATKAYAAVCPTGNSIGQDVKELLAMCIEYLNADPAPAVAEVS